MLFLTEESEFNIDDNKQLLYFYANWMPFHKKVVSMVSSIEEKYKDLKCLAIDVDDFKILCKRFSVSSIPEIIIFSKGIEVKRINGLFLMSALRSVLVDIYGRGANK